MLSGPNESSFLVQSIIERQPCTRRAISLCLAGLGIWRCQSDLVLISPKQLHGDGRILHRHAYKSLANVIDLLDPDVVILGGGVSRFGAIYSEGVKEVARFVFSDSLETPIVKHQLGDSAGVIGAALIGI